MEALERSGATCRCVVLGHSPRAHRRPPPAPMPQPSQPSCDGLDERRLCQDQHKHNEDTGKRLRNIGSGFLAERTQGAGSTTRIIDTPPAEGSCQEQSHPSERTHGLASASPGTRQAAAFASVPPLATGVSSGSIGRAPLAGENTRRMPVNPS